MTLDAREVLIRIGEKSTVKVIAGNFRGLDGLRALVDFDGGRVPAHFATSWRPVVNDDVWVMVVDGVAWMIGPTAPPASDGTVASVAGGLATISTDIGEIYATYNQGVTLTAGQQVKLISNDGYHVVGVKSTSPAPPEVPPAGGSVGAETTQTFTPVDSGSFQSYWWTSRVYSSSSNQGCWFYGSKIPDTIPANAEILAVQINLSAVQIQGGDPTFVTHGHKTKPSGHPGLGSGTAVDVTGSGWYDLPLSFGNALRAGGGAFGVGCPGGGYNIFAGGSPSGDLRIRYRT